MASDLREQAKLAEQCERFEDMARFMKEFFESDSSKDCTLDETREDRNLLSVAYKNVVGTKRAALRILRSIANSDSSSRPEQKEVAGAMIPGIEKELKKVCQEVVDLVDACKLKNKGPKPDDSENVVFYNKLIGDYYRYLCEAYRDQGENGDNYPEKAQQAYKTAIEVAEKDLVATHPIRLGLALNASVFYYEIKYEKSKACQLAKEAFDSAIAELDNVNEDSYKDSTLIMQLLRDNLTLWTSEEPNDDNNEKEEED